MAQVWQYVLRVWLSLVESSQLYLYSPINLTGFFSRKWFEKLQLMTPPKLKPSVDKDKLLNRNPLTGKNMGETAGKATEEGFQSQDGQTCTRCAVLCLLYNSYTHMLLKEGAAVMVEDRWKVLAMRGWSQAVVQCQWDGGQFIPELIILLIEWQKV